MSILEIVEKVRSSFILAACIGCISLALACGSRTNAPREEERSQNPSSSISSPGATPENGPPSGAQGAAHDERPVIVTFGDSLTAGVAGRSYPDDLQDLLDQSGYNYRVDNQGVSGDTTTDGLARIENVTADHPALVVLEFGGNDGLRGIPVEETRKNLEEMIVRLKEAKLPLVLLGITLPPNYGPDYVKPFTAMFPQLAAKYHLSFMPFLLLHVYQNQSLMQPDGIHPNGEGNKIVAHDVFELIRPMLSRKKKAMLEGEPTRHAGSQSADLRSQMEY